MKALVIYGSKRDGTHGLAEMIGSAFRAEGWLSEVRSARAPGGANDADVVLVGGALYMNHWHKDARRFVREHRAQLSMRPVWLFSSGPLDDSARPGAIAPVPQVQKIARDIEASGHMTFGGRLEPNAHGFFAHSMAKRSAGDWRDPEQVTEWVREICRELALPGLPQREIVLPRQRSEEPDVQVIDLTNVEQDQPLDRSQLSTGR